MQMHAYRRLIYILDLMEDAMRDQCLWSSIPPSVVAMASNMPFCCDAMPLVQWLQWVLLPRLRAIVEVRGPLPVRSGIAPYAEVVWPNTPPYPALLAILRDLDTVLGGGGEPKGA